MGMQGGGLTTLGVLGISSREGYPSHCQWCALSVGAGSQRVSLLSKWHKCLQCMQLQWHSEGVRTCGIMLFLQQPHPPQVVGCVCCHFPQDTALFQALRCATLQEGLREKLHALHMVRLLGMWRGSRLRHWT